MKLFSPVFVIIATIGSCLISCDFIGDEKHGDQVVSRSFRTNKPSSSIIRIKNSGEEVSSFLLNVNNLSFSDSKELESTLIDYGDSTEAIEKRAWRYVKDHAYFDQPLTDSTWIHDPGIFINSLGFGYCDDKASVLAFIWEKLGLYSRVWSLGGHVVPEVYVNDGWSMYDPEYEVYYQTNPNYVNGVEDLAKQPSIVRSGYLDKMPCNNIHAMWNRYSYKTAKTYFTTENNLISDWYSSPVEEYPLIITIPPMGIFEFPGKFESTLISAKGDTISSFANAKLTIPKGWSGNINIPLVIHSIKGKGELVIAGKKYMVGSKPLCSLINSRTEFVCDLNFNLIQEPIEIIYLVNPLIFGLIKENNIVAKGINTKTLDFSLALLHETEEIRFPKRFHFPKEAYNIEWYMTKLFSLSKLRIKEKNDLYRKLLLIITSNNKLSQEEMETEYRFLYNKIEEVFSSIGPDVSVNELAKTLNDDVYFSVFISLIEHLSTDEIIAVINDGSNLKNHSKIHDVGI